MCTQCMQFIVCVYLNSSFKTHCIELGGKATSQVYEDIEQALFFFRVLQYLIRTSGAQLYIKLLHECAKTQTHC